MNGGAGGGNANYIEVEEGNPSMYIDVLPTPVDTYVYFNGTTTPPPPH